MSYQKYNQLSVQLSVHVQSKQERIFILINLLRYYSNIPGYY